MELSLLSLCIAVATMCVSCVLSACLGALIVRGVLSRAALNDSAAQKPEQSVAPQASSVIGYVERILVTACVTLGLSIFLIPIFAAKLMMRQSSHMDFVQASYVYLGSIVSAAVAVVCGVVGVIFLVKIGHFVDLSVFLPFVGSGLQVGS